MDNYVNAALILTPVLLTQKRKSGNQLVAVVWLSAIVEALFQRLIWVFRTMWSSVFKHIRKTDLSSCQEDVHYCTE